MLSAGEVERTWREGCRPAARIEGHAELAAVLRLIGDGHFARGDTEMFRPLLDSLWQHDPFPGCADYADYVTTQDKVSQAWADPARWARMSMMNVARAGKFSSDRSIREYCDTHPAGQAGAGQAERLTMIHERPRGDLASAR